MDVLLSEITMEPPTKKGSVVESGITNSTTESAYTSPVIRHPSPVERGVYFDGWFPGQHCYHPSLPPRRLRMIEHLVDYKATVLVWSALGGGSISLPYLEEEAFGEIDPRLRFYGFLNDSEFIAECRKHGIKVFGIVFEVQGWEFPVEFNEAEDRVLALNELRGAGKRDWMGLREFSQNRYPKLWEPFEHYFPGGLTNSDSVPVTDLLDEACSRDIYGVPCHAHWVECPDREHFCYTMDRNNPVWREYLMALIRIQIDAGVDGVQLDEAELPLTTLQYGGCFCKDCMKGFRAYLQGLAADALPQELRGADLESFHYGEWLLARGYDFKSNREQTPLYPNYLRFQRAAITRYFHEIAEYAREYARSQGREVLVSGNFFNLLDQYYALEPDVDLIITEMRNTRYRQPAWYRYVAGFAGPKPVVVVENPYGGIVPELVADLERGRSYDRFRMSLYEAAALGANMSVPYGAWMGSIQLDAWYPPHDLCVEIQSFLADHEDLFSRQTWHETAVVYSIESNFLGAARPDQLANNLHNASGGQESLFWRVSEALCDAGQPYDVLFFPEGELRPDTLTATDLRRYQRIILPDCHSLTPAQAEALLGFLNAGGALVVLGSLGENLGPPVMQPILDHAGTRLLEREPAATIAEVSNEPQVMWEPAIDAGITVQHAGDRAVLHLIRYDFDQAKDRTPELPELTISLRLPGAFDLATVVSANCEAAGVLERVEEWHRLTLRNLSVYTCVELAPV